MAFSTNNSSDEKGGSGGDDNGNGTSPSLRPQQQQQQQQQQDKEQQPTVPTKGASAHGAEFSSEKPLAQQQAGASQQTGGVGVGPDTTSNTTSSGGNATMGGSISAPKGPGWQALKGDEDEAVVGGGGVVAEQRVAAAASAGPDEDDEDDDTTSNKKKGRGSSDAVAVQHERGTSHHLMMPYTDAVSPASAGGAPARPASLDVGSATPEVFKVYKRRWFGLVQLTLLNIIASWDWLTFSPVSGHAAHYFSTDETTINWLSTAFMFSFVFIMPLVIYVLHLGPKPSIVTAAALILAGNWVRYIGCRAGARFGLVMFGQILTGLAQPFVLAAPTRYSDLWFTNRGRVGATALTTLANPFGAALGQLIVPFWVNAPGDIPSMVLWVSLISTVSALPSFFIPAAPPTPVAPSAVTPKLGLGASARILFGQVEFWLLFVPFAVYVGFFNSVSSLINQIMEPHGYSDEEAGIAGALLIVVGLVTSAVTSPIIDRTKAFLPAIRIAAPLIALSYLVFIWMPTTRDAAGVAGPYVVLSVLGAASFSMVPVVIEYLVELTHPISPEVTSTIAWSGGQLLGGIFIVISGALKAGSGAAPPYDMHKALVFTAVVAMAVLPLPLCLGLFGRADKLRLRRVRSDELALARSRETV